LVQRLLYFGCPTSAGVKSRRNKTTQPKFTTVILQQLDNRGLTTTVV
jgi:hypothetical protein